ncbi:MAG: DUF523 and DUF1722 domain-containing protein [Gammaproteobacteria bacterium]|nr:DUF523 and DUF1722 domain-containing protein [Gammaproteobacteria bacterium]
MLPGWAQIQFGIFWRRVAEALPARPQLPLRIAISDCLLGREVRYDGTSARTSFPHTLLDGLFEFRGICPEVGIGLGTPRRPIRLVGSLEQPRVVGVRDPALDVTDALTQYGTTIAETLTDVVGYVFMEKSPSCGLFRVKVHGLHGAGGTSAPLRRGRGVHAAAIVAALPNLPVEESGRLHDRFLRDNFMIRVYAYAHWQKCFGKTEAGNAGRLVEFHRRYEYLLMAHSVSHYRKAVRLVDDPAREPVEKVVAYASLLMDGLATPATRAGHASVLARVQHHLNGHVNEHSRLELARRVAGYRRWEQALQAPLALIRRLVRENPDEYLRNQIYLDPYPGYHGLFCK